MAEIGENSTQNPSAISGIMSQVEFLALHMTTGKLKDSKDRALTS